MNSSADRLPVEVLAKIFSYCSFDDLVNSFQFVCSWWQQVSHEKRLWKDLVYKPDRKRRNKEIIKILRITPQLKALDLTDVPVDGEIIEELTHGCPQLQHLLIKWDDVLCFDTIVKLPKIKSLTLVFNWNPHVDFKRIDEIFPDVENLQFDPLEWWTTNDLVAYLEKKKKSLHTLRLLCCTSGGYCILPRLSVCENLKNLTLCGSNIVMDSLHEEGMAQLRDISSLTLKQSDVCVAEDDNMSFLNFFPGITVLQLDLCSVPGEEFSRKVALHCPGLQKLVIYRCFKWHDDCFKYAHHLQKLSYLSICNNYDFTDEGVANLQKISHLTYLEFYLCKRVTVDCLKLICGFEKLQILKFDLHFCDPPLDLKATDVKNRNLHLMFYHCKDVSSLENLRKQHLSVTMLETSIFNFVPRPLT